MGLIQPTGPYVNNFANAAIAYVQDIAQGTTNIEGNDPDNNNGVFVSGNAGTQPYNLQGPPAFGVGPNVPGPPPAYNYADWEPPLSPPSSDGLSSTQIALQRLNILNIPTEPPIT